MVVSNLLMRTHVKRMLTSRLFFNRPLALGDPALFHVSLQTACLDEELLAQKGFQTSELLMADSVALLRRKVEDTSLAIQDGTMNSVITLAAIEFGKGNVKVAEMHVDGVKRLVNIRGGINAPQFGAQDDLGTGSGIPPIPEWQLDPTATYEDIWYLGADECDFATRNVFMRLRNVFHQAKRNPLPPTRLHDLACFVIHRLLTAPNPQTPDPSPLSECIRYALVSYMFVTQGPTYYSHAVILEDIVTRYMVHIRQLESGPRIYDALDIWLLAIGLMASAGTADYHWFVNRARVVVASLELHNWDDVFSRIKGVLWLDVPHAEACFRPHWDDIFRIADWVDISDQG
ncbi:hypothetical protein N0V90_007007 [Kalmusia sp. IMI 367209]|nr:hypothetical protein N0V90_007007 [Kalmusia sp. IMI 367209]